MVQVYVDVKGKISGNVIIQKGKEVWSFNDYKYLIAGEKIFVKDYDILVTEFTDRIKYAEFMQKWEAEHKRDEALPVFRRKMKQWNTGQK